MPIFKIGRIKSHVNRPVVVVEPMTVGGDDGDEGDSGREREQSARAAAVTDHVEQQRDGDVDEPRRQRGTAP